MILVTGDTHGDDSRFKNPLIKKLKKGDSLIICGDFGFIWNGSKKEKRKLKRLGKRKYNILFVEGVHENFEELLKYEIEEWHGGLTRKISGNLRQLIRGYVFELEGKKILAFGGGRSDDNYTYIDGKDDDLRWAHEIPSEEEFAEISRRLENENMQVDYVVSYEPPAKISEFIELGEADPTDRSHINSYLETLKEKMQYKMWYFGRHHINKFIPKKYQALFESVMILK